MISKMRALSIISLSLILLFCFSFEGRASGLNYLTVCNSDNTPGRLSFKTDDSGSGSCFYELRSHNLGLVEYERQNSGRSDNEFLELSAMMGASWPPSNYLVDGDFTDIMGDLFSDYEGEKYFSRGKAGLSYGFFAGLRFPAGDNLRIVPGATYNTAFFWSDEELQNYLEGIGVSDRFTSEFRSYGPTVRFLFLDNRGRGTFYVEVTYGEYRIITKCELHEDIYKGTKKGRFFGGGSGLRFHINDNYSVELASRIHMINPDMYKLVYMIGMTGAFF